MINLVCHIGNNTSGFKIAKNVVRILLSRNQRPNRQLSWILMLLLENKLIVNKLFIYWDSPPAKHVSILNVWQLWVNVLKFLILKFSNFPQPGIVQWAWWCFVNFMIPSLLKNNKNFSISPLISTYYTFNYLSCHKLFLSMCNIIMIKAKCTIIRLFFKQNIVRDITPKTVLKIKICEICYSRCMLLISL